MTRVLKREGVEVGGRKCIKKTRRGNACSRVKGEGKRKGIEKRIFWCWSTTMVCSRRR